MKAAIKLGRLSSGAESDKGRVTHALPDDASDYSLGPALCGTAPGRTSVGWKLAGEGAPITCRRCQARIPAGPVPCPSCDGEGTLNGRYDCRHCAGTGWEDRIERMHCARCERLVRFDTMHPSPDEDGQRAVCEPCVRTLELQHQQPWD